jgi:hypothetical protein
LLGNSSLQIRDLIGQLLPARLAILDRPFKTAKGLARVIEFGDRLGCILGS